MWRVLILTLGLMAVSSTAAAAPITYQGQLQQVDGPFTGIVDMEFQLYDAPEGGKPHGDTVPVSGVPVEGGLFQVELDFGDGVPFEQGLWLQVTVAGEEMIPRQPITAAPLALRALSGDGDSVWTVTGASISYLEGAVSIGAFTGPARLNVRSNTGEPPFTARVGDDEALRITEQGRVGIGTDGPDALLHVGAPADTAGLLVEGGGITGLRVRSDGRVGIGSTNPFASVQTHIGGRAEDTPLQVSAGSQIALSVRPNAGVSVGEAGFDTPEHGLSVVGNSLFQSRVGVGTDSTAEGVLRVEAGNTRAIRAVNNGNNNATIWATNENTGWGLWIDGAPGSRNYFERPVGIGTSNPDATLHVAGGALLDGQVGIANASPRQQLSVGDHLDIYSGGANNPSRPSVRGSGSDNMIVSAAGAGATYINYDGGSGGIRFHNGSGSGGEVMRVRADGRVMIGNRPLIGPAGPSLYVEHQVIANNVHMSLWIPAEGDTLCHSGLSIDTTYFGPCTSSARYKHDIVDLEGASTLVEALRPVRFSWNKSGSEDIGLIAEEVADVIPELANFDVDGEVSGVNYRHMVAVLIKAMQEGRQYVDAALAERDARIVALTAELEHERREIDQRLAALEALLPDGAAVAAVIRLEE